MRRVYEEAIDTVPEVPAVSVSVAITLGVVSIGVLIYFIHHIAQSMQAGHIVSTVYRELETQVVELFPERVGTPVDPRLAKEEIERVEELIDQEGHAVVSELFRLHSGY